MNVLILIFNLGANVEEIKYMLSSFAALYLQNDKVGDGKFTPELVKSLREYADALERNEAGFNTAEIFNSTGGTTIKSIVGFWCGDKNTLQDTGPRPELVLKRPPCQL